MLSRLLSPSGFVLALILLVLPFVGVACSDPEAGTLDGSYSGYDLVTGGTPSYTAAGDVADRTLVEQVEYPEPGVQVLAIVLAVLLLAGLAAALLPLARTRAKAGVAIAGVAAAVTVIIQVVAQSNIVGSIQELLLVNLFNTPTELHAPLFTSEDYLSEATGTRVGFWLLLAVLLAAAAVNVLALRSRSAARTG